MQVETERENIEQYLSVGMLVLMHIENIARYRTVVRGWQKGRYIILDSPMQGGTPLVMRKKRSCLIRFISGGAACGFDTTVVERGSIEAPLLRISWPKKVEVLRVRKHERIEMTVPCKIVCHDGGELAGELCDLSARGCRLLSRTVLREGVRLGLSFVLPDGSSIDQLEAEVCSSTKLENGASLGCKFEGTDREPLYDIEFFVSTTLERMRVSTDSRKRVLIIEPDLHRGAALREALEGHGHAVTVASGVVEGFFRLRVLPPALVLMSYDLAELPGPDVCRVLKKSDRFEAMPVFIYGSGAAEAERQALEAGAERYLASAANPEQLAGELTVLLSARDREEAARQRSDATGSSGA